MNAAETLAVVGSPDDDAFGLSGPTPGPGNAHLFRRSAAGWVHELALGATGLAGDADFGRAVAVYGGDASHEVLVAYRDWDGRGVVRRYREVVAGSWVQDSSLLSPATAPGDDFGAALAVWGSKLAVGAPGEGRVYLYHRSLNAWQLKETFETPAGTPSGAGFGAALALRGDGLIVGAPQAQRAFVFRIWDGTWYQAAAIAPPAGLASSDLGVAVAQDGGVYAAGSPSTGTIHVWSIASPSEQTTLLPPTGFAPGFGAALAARGGWMLAGAPAEGAVYALDLEAEPRSLAGDRHAISLSAGGAQTLVLDAGAAHAGELYWMLGSLSGTAPGTPLLGVEVPLAYDPYLNLTLSKPASGPAVPPLGFLDAAGRATVAIALPSGMNPDFAGLWAHHAFFTWNGAGIAFASEAERVKLVD